MKKKRKPNYKLRRIIARIIIVLLIIIPLIFIFRVKIINAPLYMKYHKNTDVLNALFEAKFNRNEVKDFMPKLIKKKGINDYTDDYIISLSNKGYKPKTIRYVLLNFKMGDIKSLINGKYDKDVEKMITDKLFNYEHYDRYLNNRNENEDISKTILKVELNQDLDNYSDITEESNPDSLTAFINKHRYINEDYEPSDLVDVSDDYANNYYGQIRLREETYEQFKKMVDDANKEDLNIYADTGYRTFKTQKTIYNNYVYENGYNKASLYAAKAGFSEHELGTAIDVSNGYLIEKGDPEYNWLMQYGYKYGFIFRYFEDNIDLTGFAEEPWHIRYVGVDVATKIHEENLTFEEYWIKYVYKKEAK